MFSVFTNLKFDAAYIIVRAERPKVCLLHSLHSLQLAHLESNHFMKLTNYVCRENPKNIFTLEHASGS